MQDTTTPTILVVDDNRDNANIVRDYLATVYGHVPLVAYGGDEALAIFERERPSLVLLDVMMPGRDGWEVCRAMKSHPEHGRGVRIVMLTALDDLGNKRQALQTGADDFLEKPLDFARLAAAVRRNLAALTPSAA